jgi:Tfp pilus assembly protein PilN
MLRANLSTRPFYNERLVHIVLAVVAGLVLAVTLLNIVQVIRLSTANTSLSARMRDDRVAAEDYAQKARQTRQRIDVNALKVVSAAASEANALIDGRTFSWTQFLTYIERTLPPDVMLTQVRPSIEREGTRITMIVLARRSVDIDEFTDKLEATGAFERGVFRQIRQSDTGDTEQGAIEIWYTPEHAEPDETPPPATPGKQPKPAVPPPSGGKGAMR